MYRPAVAVGGFVPSVAAKAFRAGAGQFRLQGDGLVVEFKVIGLLDHAVEDRPDEVLILSNRHAAAADHEIADRRAGERGGQVAIHPP